MQLFKSLLYISLALSLGLFSNCKTINDDPCHNRYCGGGDCVDGTCECYEGYEGQNCEIETRSKYIGTFSGYIISQGDTFQHEFVFQEIPGELLQVKFDDFYIEITDKNSFDIPDQQASTGTGTTLSGNGTLVDGQMEMWYTAEAFGIEVTGYFNGTKN